MGSNVAFYFLKWVESDKGGKGGPEWVENHVESFVNVAGPLLGVPKAMTAELSGLFAHGLARSSNTELIQVK